MPDRPDWSKYLPGSTRHSLEDMSELAARLGSPDVYDRRGEVVWMDTFGYGLAPWIVSTLGDDAAADIVVANTDLGGYALKLVGGSTTTWTSFIERQFSLTTLGKAGLEVSIWIPGAFDEIYIYLLRNEGTQTHKGVIKLTWTGGLISYLNSGNTYTQLASGVLYAHTDVRYNNIKLVVDMVKDEYVRFLFDEVAYPVAGESIRVQTISATPGYQMIVELKSRDGENDYVQIGRVIVTGNEP